MTARAVTLVSGGSRGIGFCIAQAFRDRGYRVIVTSRSQERAAAAAVALGSDAKGLVCDVSDPKAPERLIREMQDMNLAPAALINCAGEHSVLWSAADPHLSSQESLWTGYWRVNRQNPFLNF